MTMMQIRIMRVCMHQWFVRVFVSVRLRTIPRRVVFVLMMRIVAVLMRVHQAFMPVNMAMPFADVQPNADRHHGCRQPEC